MITIDFITLDTPTEKFRDITISCFYLYDTCLVRKISGYCLTDGKDEFFLESICISKEHICRIDMYYHQINNQYYIEIDTVNGDETKTFFNDEEFGKCEATYNQIRKWRYGI